MRSLVVLFYAAGGVGQLLDNFPAQFSNKQIVTKRGVFTVTLVKKLYMTTVPYVVMSNLTKITESWIITQTKTEHLFRNEILYIISIVWAEIRKAQ